MQNLRRCDTLIEWLGLGLQAHNLIFSSAKIIFTLVLAKYNNPPEILNPSKDKTI